MDDPSGTFQNKTQLRVEQRTVFSDERIKGGEEVKFTNPAPLALKHQILHCERTPSLGDEGEGGGEVEGHK